MIPLVLYGLKRKIRQPVLIVNLTLLPLLLILILGSALAGTFSSDSSTSTTGVSVDLGVVDLASGADAEQFSAFVDDASVFDVHRYSSEAAVDRAVRDGDVEVALVVPASFGERRAAGRSATVSLRAVDSNVDSLRATQVAVQAYSEAVATTTSIAESGRTPTSAWKLVDHVPAAAGPSDPSTGVSGMTYYGITMLVLVLIYGLANTMNFVKEEYAEALGDRYLIAPRSRFTIVSAQVVTGIIISMAQAAVVVIAAHAVFGADYGTRTGAFAAVVFLLAVFSNAIGLLLGLIARAWSLLDPVVTIAIPAMTFLAGGFVRLDLGGLQNLTLNGVFQRAMFQLASGKTLDTTPLLVMSVLAALALLVSAVMIARPEKR
ncbi:ABC transporter permease [Curtobacterium sp. ISL-83]|uniref:ABC transporter permease n=1 Tax=Curtobacterium sp. ISL-83 TaxID=2819145 RepID=UPI001BE7F268|nr:ABC transporter permease [Curtobacterium sp. ISL-83]MBT2502193.1 ABC transporter permease [Curtobacterium sp. ISL-83]